MPVRDAAVCCIRMAGIHSPNGSDGHELLFSVQEPYWINVMVFMDQTIGGQ